MQKKIYNSYLCFSKNLEQKALLIKTKSRASLITKSFINKYFEVYNGKMFIKLKITEDMVGYKLGDFVPTRKKFSFKKKKHGSKNKF